VWSLSDRHQGLVHRVAESLQPSPLDHCFCNSMKYGNPGQSSARMTIRHPITVLHLVFLCADHGPIAIVTGATVLARFGIYSDASRPCGREVPLSGAKEKLPPSYPKPHHAVPPRGACAHHGNAANSSPGWEACNAKWTAELSAAA